MDFSLSEEQLFLRDEITRFSLQRLGSDLQNREQSSEFSFEDWKKCAEIGLLGLAMPQQYGGSDYDLLSVMIALESLGYGCKDNGLLFALGAQMWSVQMPILTFGTEAQKQRYLPGLINGEEIGAHAATEPDAGSDINSLRTTALRHNSAYILNGQKTFITNAPLATCFLVLAKLSHAKGASALTSFLVEKETPGLHVSRKMEKMGLRTATMGEVVFEDCQVPAGNLLGKEGGGSAVFASSMQWERLFILAPALGSMKRQLEACIKYTSMRRQFGKPISKFQSVANKIVEMRLRLETARLLCYKAVWMKQVGKRLTLEPSEVKLQVSEGWIENSLHALKIHGAYGYMIESGIERDLRDALASRVYSGTSEIQKVIIARYLGL